MDISHITLDRRYDSFLRDESTGDLPKRMKGADASMKVNVQKAKLSI